jgi:hypothetical protein
MAHSLCWILSREIGFRSGQAGGAGVESVLVLRGDPRRSDYLESEAKANAGPIPDHCSSPWIIGTIWEFLEHADQLTRRRNGAAAVMQVGLMRRCSAFDLLTQSAPGPPQTQHAVQGLR